MIFLQKSVVLAESQLPKLNNVPAVLSSIALNLPIQDVTERIGNCYPEVSEAVFTIFRNKIPRGFVGFPGAGLRLA